MKKTIYTSYSPDVYLMESALQSSYLDLEIVNIISQYISIS